MSFDWSIVVAYWPRFWSGTLLTLKYAAIAIVIAMVWGILIGALSFRKPKSSGRSSELISAFSAKLRCWCSYIFCFTAFRAM